MRSSPVLSETRFSFSFFLTTAAKKPRTECPCQSVAFMIAAMVVPFGCRSIPSTVSCLVEAVVDSSEAALGLAAFDTGALRFRLEDGVTPDFLIVRFADLLTDLLMAIWLSLILAAASRPCPGP